MVHKLLQFIFFLTKTRKSKIYSTTQMHVMMHSNKTVINIYLNVLQYNKIHLYYVTMRNDNQFHIRNVINIT